MWAGLFDKAMRRFVRKGALEVTYPDGETRRYGEAGAPPARVTITTQERLRKILVNPDMGLGEGYMEGEVTVPEGGLGALIGLALENEKIAGAPGLMNLVNLAMRPGQKFLGLNRISAARKNVAHHYDLSPELYDLFLDEDRQYSCAYFAHPQMNLEEAQLAKKRHIARKLVLRPGMRVLDIGCGWGGMALTLAKEFGARVVGITLSSEQHAYATERAKREGLSDQVEFRLTDYREVNETFDRIVSVGMFEHVGLPHYRTYFERVRDMLGEDGLALIHTIGDNAPPRPTGGWIRKYIFPGGYIPSMSEMVQAIEKSHLQIMDVEVLRQHYAETLHHWLTRFEAQVDKARALYDERFCRMWRYYLTGSEMAFRVGDMVVLQVQLGKHNAAAPLTRDYLYTGAAAA